MSFLLRDLRQVSDEELEHLHDAEAPNTGVGVDYYLDELRRRETKAAMDTSTELARRAYWLTLANSLLAVVAVVIALLR